MQKKRKEKQPWFVISEHVGYWGVDRARVFGGSGMCSYLGPTILRTGLVPLHRPSFDLCPRVLIL